MPQYGSRRRLLPPAGQEEYGEVVGEAEEEYDEEEVIAIFSYIRLIVQEQIVNPIWRAGYKVLQKSELLFT